MNTFDLTGKKALVTGGGRGLGREMALTLARHGADVTLWARSAEELEESAAQVRALGRQAWIQVVDVTEVEKLPEAAARAAANMGRIDILVNNAGANKPQAAEDITPEIWDMIMNVNLRGAFFCAQAVGTIMISQKAGKIINISSQSGKLALQKRTAYCASKGAIDQVTRTLALEWAQHGIQVNAVAPTFVETAMTKQMFEDQAFKDYVFRHILFDRLATASEVAAGVVYLASPVADMVTGHILYIDGGWTIH